MNVFTRLFFILIGVVGLTIFAWGFTSSGKLSEGQGLILWSLVPASLMLLAAACRTQKNSRDIVPVTVFLFGAFFATLCFGMYKQSGEVAYGIFAWLSIMLCGTSVGMIALSTITPNASFSRS